MDDERMRQFENAYKSICKRLKTLKSIYVSNKKVDNVGDFISSTNPSRRCIGWSGTTRDGEIGDTEEILTGNNPVACSVSGEDSIEKHEIDRASIEKYLLDNTETVSINAQGKGYEAEGSARLSRSMKSLPPKDVLKKKAQEWVCQQIVGAFEDRCGKVGMIGTPLSESVVVKNMSQLLQERVEGIVVKAKKVAASSEALSKKKNLVGAIQGQCAVKQGLLDQAFNTAENGIFKCSQCQYIAEKINEPQVHAKTDPDPINWQFIVNKKIKTCYNVSNMLRGRDSRTTSINCLLEGESDKKESSTIPLVEGTHYVVSKHFPDVMNETNQMHHKKIWESTNSELVNVDDRGVKLQIEGDTNVDSVSTLKRKWMDDSFVKGGSPHSSKFIVQTSRMQLSNGSKECTSTMSFENKYTKLSHHDIVDIPNLVSDHDKHEDGEQLMYEEPTFRLVLEEESDEDLE